MKKEYETPKMEIVEMATLGNLLQSSELPEDSYPVVDEDNPMSRED